MGEFAARRARRARRAVSLNLDELQALGVVLAGSLRPAGLTRDQRRAIGSAEQRIRQLRERREAAVARAARRLG